VAALYGLPSAQELSALPAAELAARLAEAYRLIAELTVLNERLSGAVDELERQARRDSSTSSHPPSSDSPHKKRGTDWSLRDQSSPSLLLGVLSGSAGKSLSAVRIGPRARQPAHRCERQEAEKPPWSGSEARILRPVAPGSACVATTIGWAQLHVRVTLRVWR